MKQQESDPEPEYVKSTASHPRDKFLKNPKKLQKEILSYQSKRLSKQTAFF